LSKESITVWSCSWQNKKTSTS